MLPEYELFKVNVEYMEISRQPEGRGKRHAKKQKRVEVVSCSESDLRGTWLDIVAAKQMIRTGFYPNYTVLRLAHLDIEVTVKDYKTYDEEGELFEI